MIREFFKVYKLVYNYNSFKSIYFNFIVIISTFLEGISIGIIFPLLDLTINKNKENIIFDLFPFINLENPNYILKIIVVFICIFLIKSIFLVYLSWWRSGYIKELNFYFRSQIFKKYILSKYDFFLINKPSIIMRNSFNEISFLVQSIDSILKLISEFFVFFIIFLVLIYFEAKGTAVGILIFGLSGLIYIVFLRNFLKNWSKNVQYFSGKIIQTIQQSIDTIKFLKISNIEKKAIKDYDFNITEFVRYHRLRNFLSDIPRIFLELLGVIVILTIFYYLYDPNRSDMSYLVPSISLIAAAAFRLLPSIGRIMNYMQSLYGVSASIQTIQSALSKNEGRVKEVSNNTKLKLNEKIELKNITFSYPNTNHKILNNLNLKISKNEFICFVGESGVGKTTIIDLISGILEPENGEIIIDGNKLDESNKFIWQKNIGYVSQNTILYNGSIKENISILENDKVDDLKINNAIYFSKLEEFIKSKKEGLDFIISEKGSNLSGGQIQRLGIARSLYNDPQVLILDEFTSALDQKTQLDILNSIESLIGKKTIITISHNKAVFDKADKIIQLKKNQNGKIEIS